MILPVSPKECLMKMVSPLVAGYSFWASEVSKPPVFMKEFEDLKASVGFTKERWEFEVAVKPLAYIGNASRTRASGWVSCGCEAFSIRR